MPFLFLPFIIQGISMFFDEFYFHRKRGLPLWERIGHPLDSLSVLICYLFISIQPVTETNLKIYIFLCGFSCLLITKDEFVHSKLCDPKENWLHAVLFVIHPITFFSAGYMWHNNLNAQFINLQPVVIFLFMIYQILYWSPLWKKQNQK